VGDTRFDAGLEAIERAPDRAAAVRGMPYVDVVKALAAASRSRDPLLANVLATELLNRYRRSGPILAAAAVGAVAGFALGFLATLGFALHPADHPDAIFPALLLVGLAGGMVVGLLAHGPLRRRFLTGRS